MSMSAPDRAQAVVDGAGGRCRTCRHRFEYEGLTGGLARCRRIEDGAPSDDADPDPDLGWIFAPYGGEWAWFVVGPEFGCTLWEAGRDAAGGGGEPRTIGGVV